jgi:hypothetical protein
MSNEKEILELIAKQNEVLEMLVDKLTSGCGSHSHGTRGMKSHCVSQEQISAALLEQALVDKGMVDTIKQRIKNPIKWDENEQV